MATAQNRKYKLERKKYLGTKWALLWHYMGATWALLWRYIGTTLTLIGHYLGATLALFCQYFTISGQKLSQITRKYQKVPEETRKLDQIYCT